MLRMEKTDFAARHAPEPAIVDALWGMWLPGGVPKFGDADDTNEKRVACWETEAEAISGRGCVVRSITASINAGYVKARKMRR